MATRRRHPDEVPWQEYDVPGPAAAVRFKALCGGPGVPAVQFIEYPPGLVDEVHRHDVGEVVVVDGGSLELDGEPNGPGSVLYIAAGTDYTFGAGAAGATFYRIVTD